MLLARHLSVENVVEEELIVPAIVEQDDVAVSEAGPRVTVDDSVLAGDDPGGFLVTTRAGRVSPGPFRYRAPCRD